MELQCGAHKNGLSHARVCTNKVLTLPMDPSNGQKCPTVYYRGQHNQLNASVPFREKTPNCLFPGSLPKSTSLTPPSVVRRMLLPLTSRWIIRLLCKCWRPLTTGQTRRSAWITSLAVCREDKRFVKYKLYKRTPTAALEEGHSLPPATVPRLHINPQQAPRMFASHPPSPPLSALQRAILPTGRCIRCTR